MYIYCIIRIFKTLQFLLDSDVLIWRNSQSFTLLGFTNQTKINENFHNY